MNYRKACKCKSTATTNRTILTSERVPGSTDTRVVVTFYPEPVCDGCNTPWNPIKHRKPAACRLLRGSMPYGNTNTAAVEIARIALGRGGRSSP